MKRVLNSLVVCVLVAHVVLLTSPQTLASRDQVGESSPAQVAWKYSLGPRGGMQFPIALGPGGQIAIQNCNDGLDGTNPEVLAVLARNGTEVWSERLREGRNYCTGPAIFDDESNLYVGSYTRSPQRNYLRSFSPGGDLRWEEPTLDPESVTESGMVLGAEGGLYMVEGTPVDDTLRGFDRSSGASLLNVPLTNGFRLLQGWSQGLFLGNLGNSYYYDYDGSLVAEYEPGGSTEWAQSPPGAGGSRFRLQFGPECGDQELAKFTPAGLSWSVPSPLPCETEPRVIAMPAGGALMVGSGEDEHGEGYVRSALLDSAGNLIWSKLIAPPAGGVWWESGAIAALAGDENGLAVLSGVYEYPCEGDTCLGTALTLVQPSGEYRHLTISEAPKDVKPDSALLLDRGRIYLVAESANMFTGDVFMKAVDVPEVGFGFLDSLLHPYRTDPPDRLEYVALGDSFASGQGAPPFDEGSGNCARSPNAYPRQFALARTDLILHFACSEAKIEHVHETEKGGEPKQIEWLGSTTDIVSITIGGNDIGFSGVMVWCWSHSRCDRDLDPLLSQLIDELGPELQAMYEEVVKRSPAAQFVVLGYPQIFPDPGAVGEGCSRISKAEMRWLREKASDVYLVTSDAVKAAAQSSGADLSMVPRVLGAFRDHEVCTADPWVNAVVPFPNHKWSFHPNVAGQAALAALLDQAVRGA